MTALPASFLLQAAVGGGSMVPFLLQVVLIFAIFYFLLIRPQSAQRKKHEEALRALKRGDQVVTAGGIVGEVIFIREMPAAPNARSKGLDDQITIKSAESRLVVERGRIARIIGVSAAAPADNA